MDPVGAGRKSISVQDWVRTTRPHYYDYRSSPSRRKKEPELILSNTGKSNCQTPSKKTDELHNKDEIETCFKTNTEDISKGEASQYKEVQEPYSSQLPWPQITTNNPVITLPPRKQFAVQFKPDLMAPIQVWRGHRGNLYFSPMKFFNSTIKANSAIENDPKHLTAPSRYSRPSTYSSISFKDSRNTTGKSKQKTSPHLRSDGLPVPIIHLDRDSVMSVGNPNFVHDLMELKRLEAQGSFNLNEPVEIVRLNDKYDMNNYTQRIQKGLVSRETSAENKKRFMMNTKLMKKEKISGTAVIQYKRTETF